MTSEIEKYGWLAGLLPFDYFVHQQVVLRVYMHHLIFKAQHHYFAAQWTTLLYTLGFLKGGIQNQTFTAWCTSLIGFSFPHRRLCKTSGVQLGSEQLLSFHVFVSLFLFFHTLSTILSQPRSQASPVFCSSVCAQYNTRKRKSINLHYMNILESPKVFQCALYTAIF